MSFKNMSFLFQRTKNVNKPLANINEQQRLAIDKFKNKVKNHLYELEEVSCLCGNEKNNSILISPIDRYGLDVPTHLCCRCGLIWTSKRLTQTSLEKFYQEDYRAIYVGEPQAPESFFNDQVEHGTIIYKFVKDHINLENLNDITVFEIGCGAGGILIPFENANWNVFGCDLGKEYLEKGREKGLTLEWGEAKVLKKYGKADLIILSHVLEHFPDPIHSLNQISKLLKENGYLYIEVPGIFNIHSCYKDILFFLQNAHLYHFTLTRLIALMNYANFKFIKGDECIHSLFQKQSQPQANIRLESYQKVLFYLYLTEIERKIQIRELVQRLRIRFMRKTRALLGDDLIDQIKTKLLK